tara:strand:- start:2899 stop:4254 length:1356 start_codon:yes stop_codon:yes gene_type:complete
MDNDLDKLINNLPFFIRENLHYHANKAELIEIVLDLGRRPEARFRYHSEYLSQKIISWQDLDYIIKRIGQFSNDNRAGIDRTLHRISCIRNRQSIITGLTCRVGRAIFGTISVIRDLLESEQSILILGKPGVGKTTLIREMARVLADEMQKRVIIIDTSNEIAGDSDIPHFAIGQARRMQVSKTKQQHQIMIEAVENHMPEVIIIDEIGTELEALAARTIAERGVQLIGTAHGNCLENLIKNPLLVDLIGGIQYVTLSDEEAKRRSSQKSILERKAYPAFELAIEINQQKSWIIYQNIQNSVDLLLQKSPPIVQVRKLNPRNSIKIHYYNISSQKLLTFNKKLILNKWKKKSTKLSFGSKYFSENNKKQFIFYSYCVSKNKIKKISSQLGFELIFTREIKMANAIFSIKKPLKQNLKLRKIATRYNIKIYTLTFSTVPQITQIINYMLQYN